MSSLISKTRYSLDLFRADLMGAFTTAAFIFPLALAFGVNSPFGATAGILGGIIVCLIGLSKAYHIAVPSFAIFIILSYAATDIGVEGAMLSCVMAGAFTLIFSLFKFNRKTIKISPVLIGAISFAIALIICITQVNFYFGIGVPQGTALHTLAAYKSFGFHSNWRGVLFGTITLVVMITYPIKFKKFSKKVPEGIVSLVLTTLLNVFLLNPVKSHTVIDELGGFSKLLLPSVADIKLFSLSKDCILPAIVYAIAITSVYVVESLVKDIQYSDVRRSLALKGIGSIISPIFNALPTCSSKHSFGATKASNVIAAILMLIFAEVTHPLIERIPVATLAVIVIVLAWKSPSYKSMKLVFTTGKYRIINIVLMFALIIAAVLWNLVYVIDILAVLVLLRVAVSSIKSKKR